MVSMALRDTCRQNKAHTLTPCLPATCLLSLGLCQEPHTRAALATHKSWAFLGCALSPPTADADWSLCLKCLVLTSPFARDLKKESQALNTYSLVHTYGAAVRSVSH